MPVETSNISVLNRDREPVSGREDQIGIGGHRTARLLSVMQHVKYHNCNCQAPARFWRGAAEPHSATCPGRAMAKTGVASDGGREGREGKTDLAAGKDIGPIAQGPL